MDCYPPGSSVHGILQARILEWVAMPSSRGSSQPGIEPRSPTLQADSLPSEPPGKPRNTGVGSLSLLQGNFVARWALASRLLCPWDSPGKNTGVGCHALVQGIFPTQGPNPGLPHCRQILYQLSHQRNPRKAEWVAYPFSSGSS